MQTGRTGTLENNNLKTKLNGRKLMIIHGRQSHSIFEKYDCKDCLKLAAEYLETLEQD